jgi:hypothetical protein
LIDSEKWAFGTILESERAALNGRRRNLHKVELYLFCPSPNILKAIKGKRIGRCVSSKENMRNESKLSVGKPEVKVPPGRIILKLRNRM